MKHPPNLAELYYNALIALIGKTSVSLMSQLYVAKAVSTLCLAVLWPLSYPVMSFQVKERREGGKANQIINHLSPKVSCSRSVGQNESSDLFNCRRGWQLQMCMDQEITNSSLMYQPKSLLGDFNF